MSDSNSNAGHRKRLRDRFRKAPESLIDAELLELLLMYAIPRRDVAPVAEALIERFGSLAGVLSATKAELLSIHGIGEVAVTLLGIVRITQDKSTRTVQTTSREMQPEARQPQLFPTDEAEAMSRLPLFVPPPPPTKADIRAYNNDLSHVALEYLPMAVNYQSVEEYAEYLDEKLPYNSGVTRKRYTRYLINRFYPEGHLNTALTDFFARNPDDASLKMVLFFETVRNEPAVQFVAEEVVWPALPTGQLARADLKKQLQRRFAETSDATIKRMTYSMIRLYTLLDVAVEQDKLLEFQTRPGTLASFVYVLAAEFPQPGIYAFEALEQGPMRRWLLWDREWMRRQLYNLRDLGVIAKISEIDAMRQFSLSTEQMVTIQQYFEHPRRDELALRETPATVESDA